jgi:myo-inositol-1(or 4)-monophosphatase
LCYVACGRFEGFFEYGLNIWDIAAGVLILQEAGGIITDFKGNEHFVFEKELIASNKTIQADLLDTIKSTFY